MNSYMLVTGCGSSPGGSSKRRRASAAISMRELHDAVGQILTGLKLTLAVGERGSADQAKVSPNKAQELVNDLMVRIRELSLGLRPSMLDDMGLMPALLALLPFWLIDLLDYPDSETRIILRPVLLVETRSTFCLRGLSR